MNAEKLNQCGNFALKSCLGIARDRRKEYKVIHKKRGAYTVLRLKYYFRIIFNRGIAMVGQATRANRLGSNDRVVSHDLAAIVASIEHTYALYAGPIARYVVPEAYQHWSSAHQPRLATLIKYVNRLAETLPHQADNEGFTVAASSTILAQGGRGRN